MSQPCAHSGGRYASRWQYGGLGNGPDNIAFGYCLAVLSWVSPTVVIAVVGRGAICQRRFPTLSHSDQLTVQNHPDDLRLRSAHLMNHHMEHRGVDDHPLNR